MTPETEATKALHYALATWVFLLTIGGVKPDDAELAQACVAIGAADDATAGNAAGEQLVGRVATLLGGTAPSDVKAFAKALYGDQVHDDLGEGDRDARTHRIRQYQFSQGLPWMARIWERQEDGQVAPTWMVIERMTDLVTAMDPNPWNDIDEERQLPVADFHVLWELDATTSLSIRR